MSDGTDKSGSIPGNEVHNELKSLERDLSAVLKRVQDLGRELAPLAPLKPDGDSPDKTPAIREREFPDARYRTVALSLDSIHEIFDDFDNNPEVFETRTLSDDFLDAVRLRYRFSLKNLRIILLAPYSRELHGNRRVIIARVREQVRERKKDAGRRFFLGMLLTTGYFVTGFAVLANIDFVSDLLGSFIKGSHELNHEIAMILGWLGLWEAITTFVERFIRDLKERFFMNKVEKAKFVVSYW